MGPTEPPPTYTVDPQDDEEALSEAGSATIEPQILIIPTGNGVSFQKGYLGADGEHAAIEGELQLKCADTFRYERVTVSLRTVESAYEAEIELGASEVVLHSSSSSDIEARSSVQRASFPFAIPLPPDTPQCIHTPHSSLTHTVTANIYAPAFGDPILTKSITVHTRRYSSHTLTCPPAPVTRSLEVPMRVEVQVPRRTFKVGEPLPVYVTVPVPPRELVVQQGVRLRNVRAELVRCVKLKRDQSSSFSSDVPVETPPDKDGGSTLSQVTSPIARDTSFEDVDYAPSARTPQDSKVIAWSGASCRLHPRRPIRIRLIIHSPTDSPLAEPSQNLPTAEFYPPDNVECASISQTTLLHSVTFSLRIRVAFMHMHSRTERISVLSMPITLLPPTAPLPELEESLDNAYYKKHDRPPARTIRADDADAPQYDGGVAGPSIHGGAPPPFEEREAPPPFSTAEPEASTSSRLPTFLESEHEIFVPSAEDPSMTPPPSGPDFAIEGEGTLFGFPPSEQFDGYADMDRSFTPPPTVEMASRDTDVTGLANLNANVAIEALGLALGLEHVEEDLCDGPPPPPPPPMDDPSDPPPSIDSDFRGPSGVHHTPAPHLATPPREHSIHSPPNHDDTESHAHAPPPYRVPYSDVPQDHGTGPPPYMDLVHHSH
ncbi:uncharacterized protein LAESUDRAFT_713993 [Laetiporus sulphureus 93-53]|uniref:Uncharacterized protein n=1 Tax=Laetiporus sulphureus 93-53 TaxID=1314785 RepID=A0A165EEB1_9APHY|nr:uncharacterized protein LAESUDRAFT_713993 [Laetiporus sulphureus 93-53]KZT06858.1 hypothetical protein LAESUDRAFT_713993 [Laetiporus sulphureus 93-53]